MLLLDTIEVPCVAGSARIELHHGDLTEIDAANAVDALVVSAFPNDYEPTPRSLIGALHAKGVSVDRLAQVKAVDLRSAFSCWLSQPIESTHPGLRFERILCFESVKTGSTASYVGDIFRALAPFVADVNPVRSIAMPLLTTGDQGHPMEELLPALLDASRHWISNGLSLQCIKIVIHSAEVALAGLSKFRDYKARIPPKPNNAEQTHDVFISYSRLDADAAEVIRDQLQRMGFKIYFDKQAIDVGAAWQQHIYTALESSSAVLALFSPNYIASKVCQEEFNMALFRSRKESRQIVFPVYWKTAELPVYMDMVNYIDCRESRKERLLEACHRFQQWRCGIASMLELS